MEAVVTAYHHRDQPLIVITGPTASGKSGLAIELARKYNGEIICADSRTVYKGMDIGTAKPTERDQECVRHHLLDVVEPGDRFTVADFQQRARNAIADIRSRGAIPFMVGGTGLYIDSVLLDYTFGEDGLSPMRKYYEQFSVNELQMMIKNQQIPLPENDKNKRHLIRVLEQRRINQQRRISPGKSSFVVAISTDNTLLENRIKHRADEMFALGVVKETEELVARFGWQHESLSGNIYPIIRRYLNKEISLDEAKVLFVRKDRQLAKRQVTWLKRHEFVKWLSLEDASEYLEGVLYTATH